MFMVGTTPVIGQIQAGKLRGLAVTSPRRMEGLADVPTFTEAGLPEVDVKLWFAVMAPAATQASILAKLNADIVKAIATPEYKDALTTLGEENLQDAITKLGTLRDSKDSYLAADAAYFLARAFLLDERFEDALPLLEDATGKYADTMLDIFGERLVFPTDFVGRGDMSRGGLMLRCVADARELSYAPVAGAVRRGARPPRLPAR